MSREIVMERLKNQRQDEWNDCANGHPVSFLISGTNASPRRREKHEGCQ